MPRLRSSSRLDLLVALFVILAPALARAETARPGEALVDRVVAVVEVGRSSGEETAIVTSFELLVEARLAIAERARSVEAGQVDPPLRLLQAVLRTMVDQILIQREASRLELASVTDEDIERERGSIEARLGGPGSLDQFAEATSAPIDLLGEIVLRRATVARFVARNVSLTVRVSDSEVARAYREGGHPFEGRPLDEVRDDLEAYLIGLRQRERLADWLEELRGRSRVRVITQ